VASSKLSAASMRRLCRRGGAKRVSEAAARRLAKILEQLGMKLAREALESAKLEGRKTVRLEDVDAAVSTVRGELVKASKYELQLKTEGGGEVVLFKHAVAYILPASTL